MGSCAGAGSERADPTTTACEIATPRGTGQRGPLCSGLARRDPAPDLQGLFGRWGDSVELPR
eukprot:3351904-Alexandrium_andersonii.AAC.1